MDSKDVGKRLAFEDQRRDKVVDLLELLRCQVDPFAGFRKGFLVLFLCVGSRIESMGNGAFLLLITAVADIRRFFWTVTFKNGGILTKAWGHKVAAAAEI